MVDSIMDVRVNAILVPVSPSGTGKTLILFKYSWRDKTLFDPAINALCQRTPSKYVILFMCFYMQIDFDHKVTHNCDYKKRFLHYVIK